MKTYLLFAGYNYYPGGGMNDYKGDFDSINDCYAAMEGCDYEWWQIVQSLDMSICDSK